MQPSTYGPFDPLPIVRRQHFAWPGGNGLALWVVPNIEYFHLDGVLPGIHNERVAPSTARIPDVRSWSIREYGNRVGVWRIFDVLSRHGIRGTAALNSDVCDYHPEIVERGAIRSPEDDHAIAHGIVDRDMPLTRVRCSARGQDPRSRASAAV